MIDNATSMARAAAAILRTDRTLSNEFREQIAEAMEALGWIIYEAGQYADGAEDSHYLARVLAEIEARGRAVLFDTGQPQ